MDEITIRYWSPHGRQEEKKFQLGDSKIDLVMRAAKAIDLSDVSKCNRLEILDLSHNMLRELDLEPLATCSLLRELRVKSNHLTKLNLWPLLACNHLSEVDLLENRLHKLDLSPVFLQAFIRMDSSVVLSADALLRYIFTTDELKKRFQLIRTDAAPWTAPPVIIWIDYTDMARNMDWNGIKDRIEALLKPMKENNWFAAQRGLLRGLGVEELSGFDGNPMQLLEGATKDLSFKEARHMIFDNAIHLLEEQLENDGPTLFLDIDKMRKTRASKLIPIIVEKRKKEIENISVPIKGSKVLLDTLWATYYGYQILRALGMELTTDLDGFARIAQSFEELEMAVNSQRIQKTTQQHGTLSRGMRQYLLNCIQGLYS